MEDYRDVNRALWDERAPAHAASPDYQLDRYVENPDHISSVVEFDRERLGDISGLNGVHLQCHIGTDTLSLHRLGARMSGLDFSGASIEQGRMLAERTGASIDFRQADVYDAANVFGANTFDLVYTGIGAIGWLPDVAAWARVIGQLLKSGGRFFMREGHPMMWSATDPRPDGLIVIDYPYFTPTEPSLWDEPGTYVATDVVFSNTKSQEWNHGLAEVVQSLIDAGIRITGLVEHDTVPWVARPGEMEEVTEGEWRMIDRPERLPVTYTVQGVKQ
jgi:SAM-dependent methyltransferase